jgi:threonine 3-dehydrogenase
MANKMLAVLKDQPGSGVVVKQIAIPAPKKDEILIKVKASSICGTDVSIYDWTPWAEDHITPPIVIGHEVVGEIIEINSDQDCSLKEGDLISSETHIFCDRCYQCQINNRHICERMELFGIGRDGGFAQYATVPIRTAWKNDKSIPLEQMSVQEPLGNAVHVVDKANVAGKIVLVIGLGPTGLCAVAVARAYGASRVYALNRGEYRRKLGDKVGVDASFETLPKELEGKCDVVLEMSGNTEAMDIALRAVRIAGTIIVFGIPKNKIAIDIGKYLINKEITIGSVFGRRIWKTWHKVSSLLKTKKVDLSKIITHRFKLKEFEEAMRVMKSRECGKIILTP